MSEKIPISKEEVAEYLLLNPDFFKQNPEILKSIEAVHDAGGAVSLIQKQVELLRENYEATSGNLIELLKIAKQNEDIFKKSKNLVLLLIKASSIGQLIEECEAKFESEFGVDKCVLIFFKNDDSLPKGRIRPVKESLSSIGDIYSPNDIYIGEVNKTQADFVFGKRSTVRSCILVPIKNKDCPGILALGSKEKDKYNYEDDTLFLEFISDCLNNLLDRNKT
tara:strand:- start:3845 stop:4510 length:666 start_codon:yes stop_codon:yes gene_type:complete